MTFYSLSPPPPHKNVKNFGLVPYLKAFVSRIGSKHVVVRSRMLHCGLYGYQQLLQLFRCSQSRVGDSLRSLRKNEHLWANRSDRSGQMNNHERIAQVDHDKRATVRDSIRSLMIKELMSKIARFLEQVDQSLFHSSKMNDSLKKI